MPAELSAPPGGPRRTVGVEEELLLVDARTGAARSVASRVLRVVRSRGEDGSGGGGAPTGSVGPELQEQQLETDTPPEHDLGLLEADLRQWREAARSAAAEADALILASGTSLLPVDPQLFEEPRYVEMAKRFRLTADDHLSCGCHVHVSVDSDDEAIAVLDRIRDWLPVLLSLSVNSPFSQGVDSGYASYRSQAMTRWPTSGPTEAFGSAAAYRDHLDRMLATGVLIDEGMVYSDARPSRRYPTLEVRVADVCLEVDDAVLIAGLSRALVTTASAEWQDGVPTRPTSVALLRLATWQAARFGLSGDLLDPTDLRPRPAAAVIDGLLTWLEPALRATGDLARVKQSLDDLRARGTGADRQRALLSDTGQLHRTVLELARLTGGEH